MLHAGRIIFGSFSLSFSLCDRVRLLHITFWCAFLKCLLACCSSPSSTSWTQYKCIYSIVNVYIFVCIQLCDEEFRSRKQEEFTKKKMKKTNLCICSRSKYLVKTESMCCRRGERKGGRGVWSGLLFAVKFPCNIIVV